jgi:predicted aspartyl protease
MSLRFPYRLVKRNRPIIPLEGRHERPRPVVTVTLIGPIDSFADDALLDTGADDTVFPATIAEKIGIDLTNAPEGFGEGVGTSRVKLKYAKITLRLTDGHEYREWTG